MDFLRGCPRADGAEPADRGRTLRQTRSREIAALEAWAEARGLTRDWLDLAPHFREGGAEHDVYQDAASQRWLITASEALTQFLLMAPEERRREVFFRSRLAFRSSR